MVRFRDNGVVSVVYEGKRGNSFVGEAEEAYNKFINVKSSWKVSGKGSRKGLSVKKRTLLERDGDKCFYCGEVMIENAMSIEHLLSINHGGNNHISNLVLCHIECNKAVGHMSVMDKVKYRESKIFNK